MKGQEPVTKKEDKKLTRREFIAGTAAMSFAVMSPSLVRGAEANSKIKLGILGCGMRGKWITDLFAKNGNYEIYAAADYFPERVDELGVQFGVDASRRFSTLSGYKKLLESGVEAVAIETPPYFHPQQAADAIDAGVNVIVAKPPAVDVPGCVLLGQTGKKATEKKLVFMVDFQTRTNEFYREAVKRAHELRPDVILMDLLMPRMDGIAATATIRRELPEIEVVALTSVLEDASVVEAIRAGAIGYLLKDTEVDELRRSIKAAAAGQVQLSPRAAERLLREASPTPRPAQFTERELGVLRLLAVGHSNKEIAHQLNIGEQTVKSHVSHILGKLSVVSRTQAALYAMQVGLVPGQADG